MCVHIPNLLSPTEVARMQARSGVSKMQFGMMMMGGRFFSIIIHIIIINLER